jgi:hypothetical protein
MLHEHGAPPLVRDGCYESETRLEQNAGASVLLAHGPNKFNRLLDIALRKSTQKVSHGID